MKRDATGRRTRAGRGGAATQPSAAAAATAAASRSSIKQRMEARRSKQQAAAAAAAGEEEEEEEEAGVRHTHAPLGGIRNMMQVFGSSRAAAISTLVEDVVLVTQH
jgi:hypothetical protein